MNWDNGYYTKEFTKFWTERIAETCNPPLIISGLGFDPRSMMAAKNLIESGNKPFVLPIDFSVESSDDKNGTLNQSINKNRALLKQFKTIHSPLKIDMFDSRNRAIGGRQIVSKIYNIRHHFKQFSDVIIDIGGLPRSLFAPLLSFIIKNKKNLNIKNIHIASLPNETLDLGIISDQILEPTFMYGFEKPSSDEEKYVWIPIIGKNDPTRLLKIHNRIDKACIETCPILPFRRSNPRQTDELILDLKQVLFEEIRTFNNNIIYVDHSSPFSVYREIVKLSDYYNRLLQNLPGNVMVLITPLDNKTSSIGAIIAAVEKRLPIMYAETTNYRVPNSDILLDPINIEPIEIWVAGEAYDN
ncbi:MAG: hypothetical protein KAI40_08705 [Desulfobacterales bacterium]|nr:hypothetical protein [Desulfobacterales bacterium]